MNCHPVRWVARHNNDFGAVVLDVVLYFGQGLHRLESTHERLRLRGGPPVHIGTPCLDKDIEQDDADQGDQSWGEIQ